MTTDEPEAQHPFSQGERPPSEANLQAESAAPAREVNVDVLRGFAVFGILTMNIISFAMPAAAYRNPNSFHGDSVVNHIIYSFFHIFADQKAMGLFSLLYGASAMLLIKKLKEQQRGVKRYYYSRTLWLLAIGFAHGVLVWSGDILFIYALCGLLLFPFYRLWPSLQFALGLLVFLSALTIDQRGQAFLDSLSPQTITYLDETIWSPTNFEIAYEAEYIRGPWLTQVNVRFQNPETFQTPAMHTLSTQILYQGYVRAFGLMLIGMALYSWGVLSGAWPRKFYRYLAVMGVGGGASLSAFGLIQLYQSDWSFRYGMFEGMRFNHVATLLLVGGYVGVVLLWFQSGRGQRFLRGMAAVGRMAFTNYLMQSLLCTALFYGFGLALFATFTRLELLIIVASVWALQYFLSRWWLTHFYFGPMEWVWRALTYFRWPRLRRSHLESNLD